MLQTRKNQTQNPPITRSWGFAPPPGTIRSIGYKLQASSDASFYAQTMTKVASLHSTREEKMTEGDPNSIGARIKRDFELSLQLREATLLPEPALLSLCRDLEVQLATL